MGLFKGPPLGPSQALGRSAVSCRSTYCIPQGEANLDNKKTRERIAQSTKHSTSSHAQLNHYSTEPFESQLSVKKSENGEAGSADAQSEYFDRSSRSAVKHSAVNNVGAQDQLSPQQWCPVCGEAYEDETPLMLQCENCHIWVHGSCVGLNSSGYSRLQSSDGDPYDFFCPKCFKENPGRRRRTQALLVFAEAEPSCAQAFMQIGKGTKASPSHPPQPSSNRNLRRRNGASKEALSTGTPLPNQGRPVPGVPSGHNDDLSRCATCLPPVSANEPPAAALSDSISSTDHVANQTQPASVDVANPTAASSNGPSGAAPTTPNVLLVKPPDAYMLFRYALTAANPQLEQTVLQHMARKEWLLLAKGDRRKFVSEADKLMTKYRLEMAANQQREEPKKKRQRTAD